MSDLPLKPLQAGNNIALPTQDDLPSLVSSGQAAQADTSNDATLLSLPRTKSSSGTIEDPIATLDSLLGNIATDKDGSTAHAGLDPDRVRNLLNEE